MRNNEFSWSGLIAAEIPQLEESAYQIKFEANCASQSQDINEQNFIMISFFVISHSLQFGHKNSNTYSNQADTLYKLKHISVSILVVNPITIYRPMTNFSCKKKIEGLSCLQGDELGQQVDGVTIVRVFL